MALKKILVIEDDFSTAKILKVKLEVEGYEVFWGSNGEKGLEIARRELPHLILLDVTSIPMGGDEFCRLLRNDARLNHIPIIMISIKGEIKDIVAGLGAGADDYLTKPFEVEELVARIKAHLRRVMREYSVNPLTGLRGNPPIEEKIKECVQQPAKKFAILCIDLDNFKAFNDAYGFLKGDEVIKLVASILIEAVDKLGNRDDFIGHLGGDDFIAITTPDKADAICTRIIEEFDREIPFLYSPEDRERGYIMTYDRQGKVHKYGIMTISIGVVHNEKRTFTDHRQVAEVAADVKKYAKLLSGSVYFKDRRAR